MPAWPWKLDATQFRAMNREKICNSCRTELPMLDYTSHALVLVHCHVWAQSRSRSGEAAGLAPGRCPQVKY